MWFEPAIKRVDSEGSICYIYRRSIRHVINHPETYSVVATDLIAPVRQSFRVLSVTKIVKILQKTDGIRKSACGTP